MSDSRASDENSNDSQPSSSEPAKCSGASGAAGPSILSPEQISLRFAINELARENAALDREGVQDDVDEESCHEASERIMEIVADLRAAFGFA